MRILFVTLLEAHWGGSEVLWNRTAHHLLKRGHAVGAFFAYYKNLEPIRALREAGARIGFGTPPPTRWWKRIVRQSAAPLDRFAAFLDLVQPDLVLFSQGALTEGFPHMGLCVQRRLPYLILNQLVAPWHDAVHWASGREAFAGARHVWFVSRENLESARAWLGLALPQATVTPNAPAQTAPAMPWPESTEGWRLACVGRLDPRQKGQDLVIDALARDQALWLERGLKVSFFGAGEDGPVLELRSRTCGDIVAFRGFVASPVQIWRTHHALLLPSRYEGQSLAMLEAMLYERPVFVTPVGGTGDLVRHGHNGLLAPSIGLDGIVALLQEAWQRRASWREMGRQAAADVQTALQGDPAERLASSIESMTATDDRPA